MDNITPYPLSWPQGIVRTPPQKRQRSPFRTSQPKADAFDARLNDIVRRAVEKVAENAQRIIDAREPKSGKGAKDRATI